MHKAKKFFKKIKRVTVIGLRRSGFNAALLLHRMGVPVRASEINCDNQIIKNSRRLQSLGIAAEIGKHSPEFIDNSQLIVASPGVALQAAPLIRAKRKKIPIIGELELASLFCSGKIIAVTGTNGKSTVVTLIGRTLAKAGKKAFVCGNIGIPFSAVVLNVTRDSLAVLEVSSFQLERIKTFKPYIAVLLNISCDHLDRYKNLKGYVDAKYAIFSNQDKSDWAVLNAGLPDLEKIKRKIFSKIVYFNQSASPTANPNFQATEAACKLLGVKSEFTQRACAGFKGLQHRLEEVCSINGVMFINDSKGTNVDSTRWALNIIGGPVILIVGGRDKCGDFKSISDLIYQKTKAVIALGEAKEKLKRALRRHKNLFTVDSLPRATKLAFSLSEPGDKVMLSPMCASFDQFLDYRERGRVFKEAVKHLKSKVK